VFVDHGFVCVCKGSRLSVRTGSKRFGGLFNTFCCTDDVGILIGRVRVGEGSRSDDNIATLRKRFTTFKDITMPVVKYFENIIPESLWLNKNGINVYKIDGDREVEIVYKNVKHGYQEMIKSELIELSQFKVNLYNKYLKEEKHIYFLNKPMI
jgi:adenylate kinase family enzyme